MAYIISVFVSTKQFQTPAFDDSDDDTPEADDEKPQVVVLKKGDLTAAEAEALTEGNKDGQLLLEELMQYYTVSWISPSL